MPSAVEAELRKVSKVKDKKYKDRQDELAALLIAIDRNVSEEDYDLLSDEAVKWHHDAVAAADTRQPIPDFPDMQPGDEPPAEEASPEEAAPQVPEREKKPSERNQPDYSKLDGSRDRYGLVIGTKTHMAVQMYEKGCTTKEIHDELGGRFYNILKKMVNDGHNVFKDEETKVWKLTHKDDYAKSHAKTN